MSESNHIIEKPWHQQFWPWFLITLPALVVIACIVTLTIALNNPNSLVIDDYSKIGFATRKNTQRLDNAVQLGIEARLQLNRREGLVTVYIEQKNTDQLKPETIQLVLLHPANANKDLHFSLQRNAVGIYHGNNPQQITGRFYVQLESEELQWRLNGELQASDDHLIMDASNTPVLQQ